MPKTSPPGPIDVAHCLFCGDATVGLFEFEDGCACWTDKIQALCLNHVIQAEPIGDMVQIAEWEQGEYSVLSERATAANL